MEPFLKNLITVLWILFCFGVGYFLGGAIARAIAHEAHTGWKYDADCCGDNDCNVAKNVIQLENGMLRITVSLPLPYTNPKEYKDYTVDIDLTKFDPKKIRSSKDENIHLCLDVMSKLPRPLCIYLPAGS